LCLLAACCLLLQGCNPQDYFSDPDVVSDMPVHWNIPTLPHVDGTAYKINFDELENNCDASLLEGSLKRIVVAYRMETEQTIHPDVPAAVRKRHLDEIFPEDPFRFFAKNKGQGLLNKERIYCRVKYFFPEMSAQDRENLMLDAVQAQTHLVTQFVDANKKSWSKALKDKENLDEYLDGIRERYGLQELGKEHLIQLRKAVIKVTPDFYKAIFFAIEAFSRNNGGSACLTKYFMGQRKPCQYEKWRATKAGKAIVEAGPTGTKVANPAALTQTQVGSVNVSSG